MLRWLRRNKRELRRLNEIIADRNDTIRGLDNTNTRLRTKLQKHPNSNTHEGTIVKTKNERYGWELRRRGTKKVLCKATMNRLRVKENAVAEFEELFPNVPLNNNIETST